MAKIPHGRGSRKGATVDLDDADRVDAAHRWQDDDDRVGPIETIDRISGNRSDARSTDDALREDDELRALWRNIKAAPQSQPATQSWTEKRGVRSDNARILKNATEHRCQAEFRQTWCADWTGDIARVFNASLNRTSREHEREAREHYSKLRKAWIGCETFLSEGDSAFPVLKGGGAYRELERVRIAIRELPPIRNLELRALEPISSMRARLVARWSGSRVVPRRRQPLSDREFAVLSILLGIGPGNYVSLIKSARRAVLSASDVIDRESRYFARLSEHRRGPNG